MTRRDFQLIARVLRDSGATVRTREAFAGELVHTNPKFDRARFLRESEPIDVQRAIEPQAAGYGVPNWKREEREEGAVAA